MLSLGGRLSRVSGGQGGSTGAEPDVSPELVDAIALGAAATSRNTAELISVTIKL